MPLFFLDNGIKVFFIHIPKTGGTSIEDLLEKRSKRVTFFSKSPPDGLKVTPQHLNFKSINALYDLSEVDYTFCIVRNPYDRFESEYHYRKKLDPSMNISFRNFLFKTICHAKYYPDSFDNHIRPQSYFIQENIDIYKFEDGFDSIVEKLSERLSFSIKPSIKKLKQSERNPVKWDNFCLSCFNEFYNSDFHKLDYQKSLPSKSHNYVNRATFDSLVRKIMKVEI